MEEKCFFRHREADEKPSKQSKKGGAKGSVALLKESTQLGLLLHPTRRENRLTARNKNPHGSKQENSLNKSEIPCRFKFCENPSCKFWHPPVCLNCKSEKGCVHGDKCHFRHVEAEGKPAKSQRKVVRKDQLLC